MTDDRAAVVLEQFEISTERYDGGIRLEHRFGECDWEDWIAGCRLADLVRQANAHAEVCDGKPQPRPERPPASSGPLGPALWATEIRRALERSARFG